MTDDIVIRLTTSLGHSPSECWGCGEFGCRNSAGTYIPCWCEEKCNCDNECSCDCHEWYVIVNDAKAEIERLRINRDRWRKTAEQLARELGKVEYAQATYEDVVRDGKYDALMSTTDWEDYE